MKTQELLPRPDSALSLFNTFSLSMFAQQKYVALIYDKNGKPLWAANRHNHSFSMLIEEMLKNRFQTLVQESINEDLELLFTSQGKFKKFFPSTDSETATWTKELLPGKTALTFTSSNKAETAVLTNASKIKTPLSSIWLFSLSSDKFLAILSLSELFFRFFEAGDRMFVAIDAAGKSFTCSDALSNRLKTEWGNISNIIFPQIISPIAENNYGRNALNLFSVSKWQFPENWTRFVNTDLAVVYEDTNGTLLLDNSNSDLYSYISIKNMGIFDNEDFDFVIESPSEFPGLMLRADYSAFTKANKFPDNSGYNIIHSSASGLWQLKRGGTVVAQFAEKSDSAGKTRRLKISKKGATFKLIENNATIGEFNDTHKWLKGEYKSVILYLRPGTTARISSFEYLNGERSARAMTRMKPIAEFTKKDKTHIRFSIVSRSTIQGPRALELMELVDISALEERIRLLEIEKARILEAIKLERNPATESPSMAKLYDELPRVAQSELTVLIEGETGTGKEVMAKAIHEASKRNGKPFIKIDCMTIPENLIESELFGHEKGAFTGAASSREGRIEQAEGGTLFLDEISNLPLNVQMKLLSVLQDRQYHRLGGTGSRNANVRFIAASNKKIRDLIKGGLFREDLYYRLNQVIFALPPLRERKADIPILSRHFLQDSMQATGKTGVNLSPSAVRALMAHSWPGNIRELRNTIIRSALFAEKSIIDEKDIVFESGDKVSENESRNRRKKRYYPSKDSLFELIKEENGNLSEVARKMGATRQTVYRLIDRLKIDLSSAKG